MMDDVEKEFLREAVSLGLRRRRHYFVQDGTC